MAAWRATRRVCQRSGALIVAGLRSVWALFRRLSPRAQGAVAGATAVILLLAVVAEKPAGQNRRVTADSAAASPPSPSTTAEQIAPREATITTALVPATTTTSTAPSTTAQSTSTTPKDSPPGSAAALTVRSITDGDTLVVSDGRRVRLAQVDAPEKNECYGSESTAALTRLAAGKAVVLRRPTNGPEKDRYGRTLAEVYVGGASVNEGLVREGAAEWGDEFAAEDGDTATRLRGAEHEARADGRGLWSACSGPAAAAPPPPAPIAAPTAGGNCHPAYPDDCIPPPPPDLDCGDIKRMVRVDHRHGDPHGFDANNDGWGCESFG